MLYEDVFEWLGRMSVRYVVVGGAALALRGYDRRPADLDIVIDRSAEEARRAADALAGAGFVPTIPLPLSEVTVLRMVDREQRQIDVFARFHVPFGELFAGSELVPCGKTLARVASVADIARAKRLSGRPDGL